MAWKTGRKILVAPFALGAAGASAAICFVMTILKTDREQVGYVMIGFGFLAGLLQWWYCRKEIIKAGIVARNSILTQVYGLVIFTGICSAPAVLIGRALTGQKLL